MAQDAIEVALAQQAFTPGDRRRNLALMGRLANEAAASGAHVLLLPELCTSGYGAGDAVLTLAEPAEGESFEQMAALAERLSLAIAYGYPERDGGTVYNSLALIGPDGALLANHRKSHLYGDYERALFTPGDSGLTTSTVRGFKVALLICYEVEFPELVRKAALDGVELLLVATASTEPSGNFGFHDVIIGARATENNMFVAYANHCGHDGRFGFTGCSLIAGPLAARLARAGEGPTNLFATCTKDAIAAGIRRVPYLTDRRPGLY